MWRKLVNEHDSVPRYTITPGAALNMLATWTDSFLISTPREPGPAQQAPGSNHGD
jgi:hypothetical protein